MRALFEALLRFYEFDGPSPVKQPKRAEGGDTKSPAHDTSRFPYLP